MEVLGGADDLMEAIFSKGPMTVSVDASSEAFRFYKSGVFNNTECVCLPAAAGAASTSGAARHGCRCKQKLDELDHAVIVSGFGTTEDGQDYWLMKNTWCAAHRLRACLPQAACLPPTGCTRRLSLCDTGPRGGARRVT